MKLEFKKEYLIITSIAAIFMVSGCSLTGGGTKEEGQEPATAVGQYGLKINDWKVTGETFLSGEPMPLILQGEESKDDTPATKVFAQLQGIPGLSAEALKPKVIGNVKDGSTMRVEFTPEAPEVSTGTTANPYARLCYTYTTKTSQAFWVVRAEDYPGTLKMPTLSSSSNKAPVEVQINPGSAYYKGEITPIQVTQGGVERSIGIGIVNRDEGFIGNATGSTESFGTQNRLKKVSLEVPYWDGDIKRSEIEEKWECNDPQGDGSDTLQCNATNLRMIKGDGGTSTTLSPVFNFSLGENLRERKGRIRLQATYKYCITTPEISVTVKGQV